LTFKH